MTKIVTTILLATAATALIATGPASARTAHNAPAHAAAQVDTATGVAYDKNDPYVVLYNGRYVGRDADASVRLNLLRETPMQY